MGLVNDHQIPPNLVDLYRFFSRKLIGTDNDVIPFKGMDIALSHRFSNSLLNRSFILLDMVPQGLVDFCLISAACTNASQVNLHAIRGRVSPPPPPSPVNGEGNLREGYIKINHAHRQIQTLPNSHLPSFSHEVFNELMGGATMVLFSMGYK
jgi:hypothetical protein